MILTIAVTQKLYNLFNQSFGIYISYHIMPLVINSLMGGHTQTHTHTQAHMHVNVVDKRTFKKPGMCRPVAGAYLFKMKINLTVGVKIIIV